MTTRREVLHLFNDLTLQHNHLFWGVKTNFVTEIGETYLVISIDGHKEYAFINESWESEVKHAVAVLRSKLKLKR